MSKFFVGISLLAALVVGVAACNRDPSAGGSRDASEPVKAMKASIALARSGDFAGLIKNMLPPAEFERVRSEWNSRTNLDKPTDAERARFADAMSRLTAPDAVETLFKDVEPDIRQFDAQYQQQMPTIVAMGKTYVRGLVQQSQGLSPGEKQQAGQVIETLSQWIEKTRFTDPAKVRQVIGILSDTARKLDLKTLDEAQALTFEQSSPKLKIALDGIKQVLEIYDFSIDATLDSMTIEPITIDADTARLKISYSLLGTPLTSETEMVRIEDRWYGKDTIEKIKERAATSAAAKPPVLTPENG